MVGRPATVGNPSLTLFSWSSRLIICSKPQFASHTCKVRGGTGGLPVAVVQSTLDVSTISCACSSMLHSTVNTVFHCLLSPIPCSGFPAVPAIL